MATTHDFLVSIHHAVAELAGMGDFELQAKDILRKADDDLWSLVEYMQEDDN